MRIVFSFSIFFLIFFHPFAALFAQSKGGVRIHKDLKKMPYGCGACHIVRRDEPPPLQDGEKFCYRCHGFEENQKREKNRGRFSPEISLKDISAEFSKPSRHPVEKSKSSKRRRREIFPEVDVKAPRIAECRHCHNPHFSLQKVGVEKGKKKQSTFPRTEYEYQLCYRCHSYSANLPANETNKAIEFQASNPSYHPIEAPAKSPDVPSLLSSWKENSLMNCTDCHNNDNPKGPEGPHGSIYAPILIKNYAIQDGEPESEFAYALCYECHSRTSILKNESFTYHSWHIVEKKISCYSCHNSHGSVRYTSLIEFRPDRTIPDNAGRLEFVDEGRFRGRCYLKCHPLEQGGVDHSPKIYP